LEAVIEPGCAAIATTGPSLLRSAARQRPVRIFLHAGFIDHEPRAIGAGVDVLDYRQPNKQRCRCLIGINLAAWLALFVRQSLNLARAKFDASKVAVTDEIRRYFVSSA
jgi:hypothetical protein